MLFLLKSILEFKKLRYADRYVIHLLYVEDLVYAEHILQIEYLVYAEHILLDMLEEHDENILLDMPVFIFYYARCLN